MDRIMINLLDKIISKRELKLSKKYNVIGKKKIDNYEIKLYRHLLNYIDKYNFKKHKQFALRHYRYFEIKLDDFK